MAVDPPLIDAAKSGDKDALRVADPEEGGRQRRRGRRHHRAALGQLSRRSGKRRSAASRRRQGERGERSGRDAAVGRQPERQRGHGQAAAGRGRESEPGAAGGRNSGDGGGARRAIPTWSSNCSPRARIVNAHGTRGQTALMWAVSQKHPEVVKVLLAHHADLKLKSDVWTDVMAVPPHGYLPYNKSDSARRRDRADVRGARRRSRFGEAAGGRGRECQRCGCVGRQRHHSRRAFRIHASWSRSCSTRARIRTRLPTALPLCMKPSCAAMRRWSPLCSTMARIANAPLKTWTPTRRSSDDFNFEPALVGATPSGWPRVSPSPTSCGCW